MPVRALNIVLGIWLFISAFIWPHSGAQRANTWMLGLLCVLFAIASMSVPSVRYLNTVLAIWLFISAFTLPRVSAATTWNNALVAIGIFAVSLVPTRPGEADRFLRRRPA